MRGPRAMASAPSARSCERRVVWGRACSTSVIRYDTYSVYVACADARGFLGCWLVARRLARAPCSRCCSRASLNHSRSYQRRGITRKSNRNGIIFIKRYPIRDSDTGYARPLKPTRARRWRRGHAEYTVNSTHIGVACRLALLAGRSYQVLYHVLASSHHDRPTPLLSIIRRASPPHRGAPHPLPHRPPRASSPPSELYSPLSSISPSSSSYEGACALRGGAS